MKIPTINSPPTHSRFKILFAKKKKKKVKVCIHFYFNMNNQLGEDRLLKLYTRFFVVLY